MGKKALPGHSGDEWQPSPGARLLAQGQKGLIAGEQAGHWGCFSMKHRSGQCGRSRHKRSKGDKDDNSNKLANYPTLGTNHTQSSCA